MNTNQDFQQLEDKTFIIKLTLKAKEIKTKHTKILSDIQKNFESKGFRKGKAPLTVIEAQTSPDKIIEEIANSLIPKAYSETVKTHKLSPIIAPQIKILNPPLTLDKPWLVEITGCELPKVKIDSKYVDEIKKLNAAPKKDQKDPKIIEELFGILLKYCQVKLPPILIEGDINSRLSRLVDQTQQAGTTVDQYFKSKNTSLEQYKQNLSVQITKEWTLNLTIGFITKENNLKVDKKELDDLVAKNPKLSDNPNLIYYITQQQKVIDFLQNLK